MTNIGKRGEIVTCPFYGTMRGDHTGAAWNSGDSDSNKGDVEVKDLRHPMDGASRTEISRPTNGYWFSRRMGLYPIGTVVPEIVWLLPARSR